MKRFKISRFIQKRDVKDYLVSMLTGIGVGLFCVFFRFVIDYLTTLRLGFLTNSWPLFIRIPVYMLAAYLILLGIYQIIQRFPIVAGNGAEQTKGMLNGHIYRKNPLLRLMFKFVGSVGSLGSGMALGHEGPSIQFGGYLGVFTSRLCRVTPGREEYIISAGASAGVAAALNAPLAGPVYIIESLQKLNNYRMAICALIAGLTGGLIAAVLMPENPYLQIPVVKPAVSDFKLLLIFNLMGFYMAFIGALFTILVKFIRQRFNKGKKSATRRLFLLVIGMGLIGIYFPRLLGSGQPFMIQEAIHGTESVHMLLFLTIVSFLFTAYSQGTSFPGGAFLPLLTLGGLGGRLFGALLVAGGFCTVDSLSYFMFLGMSASFVVIMRTPLTGFLLVTEMTGHYEVLLPSLAVGIVGYFLISTLRMQSLPDDLYNMLLKRIHSEEDKTLTIYIEVMPDSYFEGKSEQTINLPSGCKVQHILRNKAQMPFSALRSLQAGDQIEFAIDNAEVEQVYQALVSLSSDPR
ncbi:MAG: chloride channel protein [Bacteroidales bacterium]